MNSDLKIDVDSLEFANTMHLQEIDRLTKENTLLRDELIKEKRFCSKWHKEAGSMVGEVARLDRENVKLLNVCRAVWVAEVEQRRDWRALKHEIAMEKIKAIAVEFGIGDK